MKANVEALNVEDQARPEAMRRWVVDHYEDVQAYDSVAGKLKLVHAILENGWVAADETVKLQSLGVALGDALVQDVEELNWVAVDDEYGRDPALQWGSTSLLVFPLTAISKRVENGEKVDVFDMFGGFLKMVSGAASEAE